MRIMNKCMAIAAGIGALVILAGGCRPQDRATIRETREIIRTYPFGDPDPTPILIRSSLWGRGVQLYPYSYIDEYSAEGEDREWSVVRMENPYVEVAVLPEVGGKIWGASEKSSGREFIYTNHVLKFRDIALRGPWTSGGIEFNFGIVGHTPAGAHPVDYLVRKHPDGSVSCVVGNMDLPSRTRWSVTITLPPDQAAFETRSSWYNPTPFHQSYYVWMNGAVHVSDDLQYVFPGRSRIGHNYSEPLRPWPVDAQGRDLSWYRNNNFGSYKSYFTVGEYADFFGGYWHDARFGFGHWARYDDMPGHKIWIWGLSRQGMIWEDLLTDSDGQYSEPQAGRLLNQSDHALFAPQSGDRWRELWFPYKDIGPLVQASPRAVLSLQEQNGQASLGICALQPLDDELWINRGDREILRERLKLGPMETRMFYWGLQSDTTWLEVRLGDELLYTTNPAARDLGRPNRFQDYGGDGRQDLFLGAERLFQQRNHIQALSRYLILLEEEPKHIQSLSRVAEILCRRGQYGEALEYARRALDTAMYDPGANFVYGVIARKQGRLADALEALGWAARSLEYRSSAYSQMAEVYLGENDLTAAMEYARRSLEYNDHNLNAYQAWAIALRKMGDGKEGERILDKILTIDPLNHSARFELYRIAPSEERRAAFRTLIRSEYAHEVLMEMAVTYHGLGMREEAIELFEWTEPYPMADYWLAYLHREVAPELSRDFMDRAEKASPHLVFPFREETIPVLLWATAQNPAAWKPKYYLALLLWSKGRVDESRHLLESCGEPDFAPLYHARAYFFQDTAPDRAHAQYARAVEVDPESWRNWFRLLRFGNREGFTELAADTAQKAAERFPDSVPIRVEQIRSLLDRGELREAAAVLDQLKVLPAEGATGVHDLYVRTHVGLGLESARAGAFSEAITHLEKSREYPENLGSGRPYDPDLRLQDYLTALCQLKLGRGEEAEALFRSIRRFSENESQGESLGSHAYFGALAYQRSGDAVKARELLRKAVRPGTGVLETVRWLER